MKITPSGAVLYEPETVEPKMPDCSGLHHPELPQHARAPFRNPVMPTHTEVSGGGGILRPTPERSK